ncbi:MAG: hypothetical protein ACE5HZ_08130 [Fidelibacterota bacterium]
MSAEKDVIEEFTRVCPFCGEYEVRYTLLTVHSRYPDDRNCFIFTVECPSCGKLPVHLTRERIEGYLEHDS